MKFIFTLIVLSVANFAFAQQSFIDNLTGIKFIEVEGSCSETNQENCVKSFFIGVYEVTQGQWQKVIKGNTSHFKKGNELPVENLTYIDAMKFVSTLNKKNNTKYRLPTVNEYKYIYDEPEFDNETACELMSIYDVKSSTINQFGNLPFKCSEEFLYTAPVGTFPADKYGIYDKFGNVSEWSVDGAGSIYAVGGSCFDGYNEMKNLFRKESKSFKFGGLGLRLAFSEEDLPN